MLIYIEIESLFCYPNNSLDEKCQKTTQAIFRCTNTFGRVVYWTGGNLIRKYLQSVEIRKCY